MPFIQSNEGTEDGLPELLAGPGGDAESFAICTSTSPEATKCQNIYYKADTEGYGASMLCTKVHLVVQPTQ